MVFFILVSLIAIGLFAASIADYFKLKNYLLEQEKEQDGKQLLPFVDVLFHSRLKDDACARKIQKRAIGFFCASLLMAHVTRLFFTRGQGQ